MTTLLAMLLLVESTAGVKIAVVQGTVEAKSAADADFVALKSGGQVQLPCVFRSAAGGKALIEISDGYDLRLSEKTELTLENPKTMVLKNGRIYLKVPRSVAPVQFSTDLHPVKLDESVADIEYIPRVPNGGPPAATTYIVLQGKIQAFSKKFSPTITAGWRATGFGMQLNTPDTILNSAVDTQWVHSLLVERGRADEETSNRATELLAIMGKESPDPAEPALRSLGELGAPEIARWISKSVLETQVARRGLAARLLGDVATVKTSALLVPLLSHKEAEVRLGGAKGLARIAGKDLGFDETFWKGDKPEAGQKAWDEWVKQNAK